MLAAHRSSVPGVTTRISNLRVALWRSAGQAFAPGRWIAAGLSPLRVAAIQVGGEAKMRSQGKGQHGSF
ncbi:hypothetical protein A0E43_18705 [Pectobacterium cacticida]